MRIALTGSTGLIGGGVFRFLRSKHDIVRIGRRKECDMYADLADMRSMSALDLAGCDAVVHCAGIVDEDLAVSPERAWDQAVAGTEELAIRAIAGGVGRLIYFSTTHVYGAFEGIISEESVPDPLNRYASAHYAAEQVLKRYALKGLKIFIIRPNAVYGMPLNFDTFDRWSLVPFDLPLQAAYKKKIVLKTSGEQKRNFIAVEDIAGYVEKLLSDSVNDEAFVLNAVGSETLKIADLARMCADIYHGLTGRICQIERPAAIAGHPDEFQLVTKHSGFRPSWHIDDFFRCFLTHIMDIKKKGVVYGQSA